MKYCKNCGQMLNDEDQFCPSCGCPQNDENQNNGYQNNGYQGSGNQTLQTVNKVLLVLTCIASAFAILPLIWVLPMTIHYFNATKNGYDVGTGFKVCTLIFVNLIVGILMLCDN